MTGMTTPTEPMTMPDTDTGLGTLLEDRPDTSFGDGDHERFAHYVQKNKIVESAVTGAPVIASNPERQRVLVGETATFSVTATGAPTSYQWQKDLYY